MKSIIFQFIKDLLVRVIKSDMWHGVMRYKRRGGNPATIIDVGAAKGKWTEKCLEIFPEANYIMVEPLPHNKPLLEALVNKFSPGKLTYIQAVASEKEGVINFCVSDDLDGSGVYGPDQGDNFIELDCVGLDSVVSRGNHQGPYIIKLDTHGYEVPILQGALKTMQQADLLIIEVYGFQVSPTGLTFWELCQYLDGVGFRIVDMVDVMRRPSDGAFWQSDAFFIPKTSSVFSSNLYQ